MRLDELPLRQPAHIAEIHWEALGPSEARRLRELGFDQGVAIEVHHHSGLFRRGPIACRVGRMTIALRRSHAAAISVIPAPRS